MNMSMFDVGTVIAVLGLFYKLSADKAAHSEEMGKIKEKVNNLENHANKIDDKLESIDEKLGNLIISVARLEGILAQNQQ